jgi:hypothetical protein
VPWPQMLAAAGCCGAQNGGWFIEAPASAGRWLADDFVSELEEK